MTPKDTQPAPRATSSAGPLGVGISRRGVLGLMGAGLVGTTLLATGCANSGSPSSSSTPATSGSPAMGTDDPTAAALAAVIMKRWPHGESVWPGLDYTKHDIVLIRPTSEMTAERAWLINVNGVRELNESEYGTVTVPPVYDAVDFQGRQSISLVTTASLSDTSNQATPQDGSTEDLLRIASHELVHFYHQNTAVASAVANRNTTYPVDPKPRIMRRMLLRSLHLAYRDEAGRDTHLGHARYWQDRWLAEYADEAAGIHVYDIREGTAKYVENYMTVVDPALSPDELAAALTAQLNESAYYTAVDSESYELGFAAGVVLDLRQPGWKDDFYTSDKTMAALLLETVTPLEEPEDPEVRSKVEQMVAEVNSMAAPAIQAVDEAISNPAVTFLRYKGNLQQLQYQDSFSYQGYTVLFNPVLELNAEGGTISVKLPAVFSSQDDEGFTIPLPQGSYTFADGVLTLTADQVNGKAKAERSEQAGREIFTINLLG